MINGFMNHKEIESVGRCFNSMGRFMSRSNVMGGLIVLNVGSWLLSVVVLVFVTQGVLGSGFLAFMFVMDALLLIFTLAMYAFFAFRRPSLLHSESWWVGMFNLLSASKGQPILQNVVDAECISVKPELQDIGLHNLISEQSEQLVVESTPVMEAAR